MKSYTIYHSIINNDSIEFSCNKDFQMDPNIPLVVQLTGPTAMDSSIKKFDTGVILLQQSWEGSILETFTLIPK